MTNSKPISVYSSLKPLAFTDKLEKIKNGEIPAPVHVRIKPTNVCNHSCYFCAYRTDTLTLGSDINLRDRISWEKMQEIVEDVIEMGVKAVTFSGGGEPLLYPNLAEVITRLGEAGIKIGVLTNGSMLKGRVAEALTKYGTWVRLSIDGWNGESYAKYRNVPETEFAKVIANVSAYKGYWGASVIVDQTNAPHIAELAGVLNDAGAKSIKVSPCIVKDSEKANNDYHDKIMGVVQHQISIAPGNVINHYHLSHFDNNYPTCPMTYLLTIIGADCKVYTCQDKAYTDSGTLGDISNRRFKDFWFSEENRIRGINPSKDCSHHCIASAKNRMILEYLNTDSDHMAFV